MELSNIKKILIINLGGAGDLLLSQAAVRPLRRKYSDTVLDILIVNRAAGLAHKLGLFDNIHEYPRGIFKIGRLLLKLRANRYDLVINMRTMETLSGTIKMFLVYKLIKGRISAGRNTERRGFFFDIKIPETSPGQKYEMEYDLDTVRALGVEVPEKVLLLDITAESKNRIKTILMDNGISNNDILVGMHPGGMPSRRWPLENFIKAIKGISGKMNCKFVITAGDGEKYLADKLAANLDFPIVNMAGELNIDELGALIKRCNLFISNDTGPMHIAAVLGTSLVAIFGPGQIVRFDPKNISENAEVLYKKADCAPCNKKYCDSMKCLKAISPEEVTNAALGLLTYAKKTL